MGLSFKKGQKYSRKDVGFVVYPNQGRPAGGNWDTGYVTVEGNNLIAFVNINIPGRTGHNFANEYDLDKNILIWFGKPKSHSNQPIMKQVINGELTSHFFIRTKENDKFTYLGVGKVAQFKDNCETPHGDSLKMWVTFGEAQEILNYSLPDSDNINNVEPEDNLRNLPQSFVIERHLEDYIVRNFTNIKFGKDYEIYNDGQGRQFQTKVGRLDILALKKDKSEFLVIELKRDLAMEETIQQVSRYVGFIKKEIAKPGQKVRGCIVATGMETNLEFALHGSPNIDFYKYKINFLLTKVDTG